MSHNGMELEFPEDYTFMARRFQYKHFVFELYVGQGSFWRIYTTDEKIGFQTQ